MRFQHAPDGTSDGVVFPSEIQHAPDGTSDGCRRWNICESCSPGGTPTVVIPMGFQHSEYCDMRGMLSFLILHLLSKKEMYGQEIAREIAKRRGEKPNPGTLYPALKSMGAKGLIISNQAGQMRIYRLTDKGRICLKKACEYFYRVFGDILEDQHAPDQRSDGIVIQKHFAEVFSLEDGQRPSSPSEFQHCTYDIVYEE